jgi:hypothetical protein
MLYDDAKCISGSLSLPTDNTGGDIFVGIEAVIPLFRSTGGLRLDCFGFHNPLENGMIGGFRVQIVDEVGRKKADSGLFEIDTTDFLPAVLKARDIYAVYSMDKDRLELTVEFGFPLNQGCFMAIYLPPGFGGPFSFFGGSGPMSHLDQFTAGVANPTA